MPGFESEIEDARSMDQLYPQAELEFLNQNTVQDPLLVKVSELIYRQYQKDKERKEQKKAGASIIIVICCLFFSLMIAYVVSKMAEDDIIAHRADTIMNMTIYERMKNRSLVTNSSSTGGLSGFFQTFHANVISPYIKNTNSTT